MGVPLNACSDDVPVAEVWGALHALHSAAISHGDLCGPQITVIDGAIRFGGFHFAEFGASDVQLQSDIAQLLVTTTDLYGSHAVTAAINVFGADAVLIASRRPARRPLPRRIRMPWPTAKARCRRREEIRSQTGADEIRAETITRDSADRRSSSSSCRPGLRRPSVHQHGPNVLQ